MLSNRHQTQTNPYVLKVGFTSTGAGVTGGRKSCARVSAMWAMRGEEKERCRSRDKRGPSRSGHAYRERETDDDDK